MPSKYCIYKQLKVGLKYAEIIRMMKKGKRMSTQRIGFSLMGDDIPLPAFLDASRILASLLAELDTAISGGQNLKWTIADLSRGSANLAIHPILKSADAIDQRELVISSALNGFLLIDRSAERPAYFTDEALKKAKEFSGVISSDIEGIAVFGNSGKGETQRIQITQRVAAHVDQLIGTSTVAIGSIEGTLETLNVHGRTSFIVYDLITGRRVDCRCDQETLEQLTIPGNYRRRIVVTGEIHFNVQGLPMSMKVGSHRFLKDRSDLPQVGDIWGLFKDNPIDLKEWGKMVREK